MKKKWIVLLTVLVLLVSACGNNGNSGGSGGSDSNGNGDEAVTLKFYIWDDEKAYITDVVDQYNASQDKIQVELTVVANDEYDDKLKVLLAADSDVDLVDIRGMSQATTYAKSGALLNITDSIESSDLDTSRYGQVWDSSDFEGDYYVLPTRSTCWALYYNADLFDEAGIDYPEQLTWEEYGDLALEIKEKTGVYGGYWVPWIFPFASVQQGAYADSEDTAPLAYSLELLNRFYNVDESHMSYGEIIATSADYIGEFESGRAAMLPNGEWCVQMFMEDEANGESDINWQIAPMPISEGLEPGTTWGQFQFAAVTSTSSHPEEAFDFLSYLCGPEGAVVYSENGMIHAYAGDEAKDTYVETVGKESVSVFFDANKVLEQPNTVGYSEILNAFNEHAELYLLGEKTLEETMSAFESQREDIRERLNN